MTENNTKSFYKALPEITKSINQTISTPTGIAADDINESNVMSIWKRLWGQHVERMQLPRPPPKYKPGQLVRIARTKLLFSKGILNTLVTVLSTAFNLFPLDRLQPELLKRGVPHKTCSEYFPVPLQVDRHYPRARRHRWLVL